jgi:hypothetical protein
MTKFENSWGIHMRESLAENSLSQLEGKYNRQSVPKRRHIKFRRRGITQKKTYNKMWKIIGRQWVVIFNVYRSVHRKNIPIYI